jgi:serine/threonine-protein kinase
MAELFEARLLGPSGFSKRVAIKKILPDLNRKESFRRMFLDEGSIMSRLSHRNILQVFELGEVEGELFMCLEYVPGCDLAHLLERRSEPLESGMGAWIAREVCSGLDYLHGVTGEDGRPLQLVHRDVNPRNILLSTTGEVKLGDFGIAKSVETIGRSDRGLVKGKLQYLSPEQATGDAADNTSDIYAVGLVLYEMLTLHRYIEGDTPAELVQRASAPRWKAPTERNPDVPRELERIIRRTLRPLPEERFGDARALSDALSRVISDRPSPPGSHELAELVQTAPSAPATAAAVEPEEESAGLEPPAVSTTRPTVQLSPRAGPALEGAGAASQRRHVWLAALGIVALSAVVGGLVWTTLFRGGSDRAGPATGVAARSGTPDGASPRRPPRQVVAGLPAPDARSNLDAPPRRRHAGRPRPIITKKAPPQPADALASPAPDATAPEAAKLALGKALSSLRREVELRGMRPRHCPAVSALFERAARSIEASSLVEAEQVIKELRGRVDGLVLDRAFIEQKLAHLNRVLERTGRRAAYAAHLKRILAAVVESKYRAANRQINAILDRIAGQ